MSMQEKGLSEMLLLRPNSRPGQQYGMEQGSSLRGHALAMHNIMLCVVKHIIWAKASANYTKQF